MNQDSQITYLEQPVLQVKHYHLAGYDGET